jgi:hypothetical protein
MADIQDIEKSLELQFENDLDKDATELGTPLDVEAEKRLFVR